MIQLEQDIPFGGLRLTNITLLDKALKISWIPELLREGSMGFLFQKMVSGEIKSVWSLDTRSLEMLQSRIKNCFWRDVFKAWSSYKLLFDQNTNIRTYPIWDTYFLTNYNIIKKRTEFEDKNVRTVNDLLHESGRFMGFEEFTHTYGIKVNFVDFYSLMHCLPGPWRENIKRDLSKLNKSEMTQPAIANLLQMTKHCKGVYWRLIETVEVKRNHRFKWQETLQMELSKETMSKYFSINFQCTVESRLRSFQYKILQRCLTTNQFLNICNINTELCYFCNKEIETLEHLFWLCPLINLFWKEVASLLKPYIDFDNVLCLASVLLGIETKDNSRLF